MQGPSMQGLLQRVARLSLHRSAWPSGTQTAACQSLSGLLQSQQPAAADRGAAAVGSERRFGTGQVGSSDSLCSSSAAAASPAGRCADDGAQAAQPRGLRTLLAAGFHNLSPAAVSPLADASQLSGLHSSSGAAAASGDMRPAAPASSQPPAPEAAAPRVPPPPWTFTRHLTKRKTLPKRMGHMLEMLEEEKVKEALAARNIPNFGPGDVLEVKLAIPQNRRRVAITKGLCIARRNRGLRTSFTIRNHLGQAGGIERSFPLFSPHIEQITVLSHRRIRRAKLYYLRDRQPKEFRVS